MHARIKEFTLSKGHPICIGFDPDMTTACAFLQEQRAAMPTESFLVRWYDAVIQAIGDGAHSIKFQSAYFESFGKAGITALHDITINAHRRGLFIILDAKRGDIATTMSAYGSACFEVTKADALTINPYMGTDVLEPLIPWLRKGRFAYIVWLTSNSSGTNLQLLKLQSGERLATHIFKQFHALAKSHHVTQQIGWVAGANTVTHELLADLPQDELAFLMPGISTQGGTFNHHLQAISQQHPASLFPISRGILNVPDTTEVKSWNDYGTAVAQQWNGFLNSWNAIKTQGV